MHSSYNCKTERKNRKHLYLQLHTIIEYEYKIKTNPMVNVCS